MHLVGLGWLDWVGLDWVGLDWVGLDWVGLGRAGCGPVGLDWMQNSKNEKQSIT